MKQFVIAILVLTPALALAQPQLEIPNDRFDFGLTPQRSTLVTDFWFKSTGDDTLRITRIKTGCSCVMMPLERDWLAPGDSMKVKIFWEITKEIGRSGKYPYIYTNIKERPFRVYMDCIAIRKPESTKVVTFSPFKFELAQIGEQSIDSIGFEMFNKFEYDVEAKVVSSEIEECDISLPEILPSNRVSTGYIRVKPAFRNQEFKRSLTVEFTDANDTRMTIPIRRKIYQSSSQ